MGASFEDEHVEDVEEGDTAENEVWPLVAGGDESTNETSDDHDLVNEDGVENGGPWHAGGQEQVHEEKGSSDDPVNVSDVEDLTVGTGNLLIIGTRELNGDGSETQV